MPLPETLHERLRAQATRSGRPATSLARQAIEAWIAERPDAFDSITFVLFSADTLETFERAGEQ